MLGHVTQGEGARRVVVLNDWLCDTSTWDGARAYLDEARCTWAFADVRGYGRSRGQRGSFTAREMASDVLALADSLGWSRFCIVGHSMSTFAASQLAQEHPERIERVVLVTPPPPRGFGYDDATMDAVRAMALGDDERRLKGLRMMLGERLSHGFVRYKAEQWRASSDAEAVAGYVAVFGRDGLAHPERTITPPTLAIACEEDAPPMRSAALRPVLEPLFSSLTLSSFADCGHYPMQEMPPR
ncbi:MAG TPA: alpha/beta hydrolase, partial [Labilithrix sp.]